MNKKTKKDAKEVKVTYKKGIKAKQRREKEQGLKSNKKRYND